MPNLTPVSSFDNVPELETTTLALGGPGGPMNLPAQALLNRTQWLKDNAAASTAGPYAAGTGTANVCAASFTPAITALADGLKLRFLAAATNTGPATFAPNALTAQPILGGAYAALQGGEILANGEVEVTWNATLGAWVITAQAGGSPQVPNASQSQQAASKAQVDQVKADLASSTAGKGASLVYDAAKASELASTAAGKGSALVAYLAGTLKSFLDSLSADGSAVGAALIGFLQTGTGAVGTTAQKKLQRSLDLLDFVDPANYAAAVAGTFDLSPALGSAIDEAQARGGHTVRLPAGKLRLNSTVAKTISGLNGFSLEGAGMGLTQLICYDASGSGLQLAVGTTGNWWINVSPSNAFRFAHFSICSTVLNAGYGIQISGGASSGRIPAPCVFDHIETRQLDSINNQAFVAGVRLIDAAQSQFSDCRFFAGGTSNLVGVGVKLEVTAAGIDPTDHHFVNCKFVYGDVGVLAGNYIEGIWFSNCVAIGMNNAVKWNTTTGESGLCWVGGHTNTNSYAFNLGNLFDVQISSALIYAKSALLLNVGANLTVTGNTFYGIDASGTAIGLTGITGSTRGSTISGNQFSSFTNGITIDATSHNVTVGLNGYSNVATRVSNLSTDSYVAPRIYAGSTVKTLTGGATSENVDIPLTSGIFSAKPVNATLQIVDPMGTDMIGFYAFADAANTATNARFRVVKRDGTTLPSGSFRFGFTICGN